MLRVREVPARVFARDGEVLAAASGKAKIARRNPAGRLLALAALGVALGSGGMVLTASMVLAENDEAREANIREVARQTEQARLRNAAYASTRITNVSGTTPSWSIAAAAAGLCIAALNASMSGTSITRATRSAMLSSSSTRFQDRSKLGLFLVAVHTPRGSQKSDARRVVFLLQLAGVE